MRKAEHGGIGRFFGIVFVLLVVLGLTAVVVYLLSDINHRRYRITARDQMLVVQKGRFMPFGFEDYEPEAKALKDAYAPVPIPPGETYGTSEIFDDRADLDRALFATLASWARERLYASKDANFELAITYVQRAQMLPGVSEQQRRDLRTLRADAAYRNGRMLLADIADQLEQAREAFETSLKLGTSHRNDADRWIREIDARIEAYKDLGDLEPQANRPPRFRNPYDAQSGPQQRPAPMPPAPPPPPGEPQADEPPQPKVKPQKEQEAKPWRL